MASLKTYYDLSKPGIIYGNGLTALAGYLLGSKLHIHVLTLVSLLIGASLVMAAACTFNNVIDSDIDSKMKRTRKRATVTGEVSSKQAVTYGALVGALGFILLAFTNLKTELIALIALLSYVLAYTKLKRISPHGTLVGTIPGAAALVAGYVAATNVLGLEAFTLFLIMVFWQMAHFYSIAIYRLKDYKAAGVPVWSVKYGVPNTKNWIIFYVSLFSLSVIAMTVFGYDGMVFLIIMGLVALNWLRLAFKGFSTKDNVAWAKQIFLYSLITLVSLCALLPLGSQLP